MNLTQRQLQLFVAAAATLNLSRASERVHLSQPAFTRALQALEAQLGARLFERSTRRMVLSADGRRFLPAAQRLLADMQQALGELQGRGGELSGPVSLAQGTAFGGCVLPAALLALRQRHPGLRVQVHDDSSQGITARVVHGEVDFGIGSPVGPASGLVMQPWLTAPLGLLAHPAFHRLPARPRVDQATTLPLVKEAEGTSIMQLLHAHASPWAPSMERGVEVSSLSLQLALVRSGVGVALVSGLAASHPEARDLQFAPIVPRLRRELVLMHRRDRPLRPAALALADSLRQALRAAPLHPCVRRTAAD